MAYYGKLGKGKAKPKTGAKARAGKAAPKRGKLGMKSQKEKKSKTTRYAYQKLPTRIRPVSCKTHAEKAQGRSE